MLEYKHLLLLLAAAAGILLLTIRYLFRYAKAASHVKHKIRVAHSWKEYVFWRKQLRILRWCALPGLTPGRIRAVIRLFYRGKYARKWELSDGLTAMLLPSVLGIVLCTVCLAGGTFAWFSATRQISSQPLQSAQYTVISTVMNGEQEIPAVDGVYPLQAGNTYTVSFSVSGNASTGYCVLRFGSAQPYGYVHTQPLPPGQYAEDQSYVVLTVTQDTVLKIIPQWGSSASKEKKLDLTETYTYGSGNTPPASEEPAVEETQPTPPTEEPTQPRQEATQPAELIHTVVQGDTLNALADKYNTTVEKLAAYNHITDHNMIRIGDTLKIPPPEYSIP